MEGYSMISEAKARADAKYAKKTYDIVTVKIRKDTGNKAKFQDYADSLDISLSELINRSLNYIVEHNIKP